jgi:cardiolipin synthase
VTKAVALRSRFEPALIPPELLTTPESPDQCPVLDEQANAPTTPGDKRATEPLTAIIDKSRATTVESAQVLMCNPHTRDWSLQRALWIATREAHRRVWVTTPYFLPHGQLFRAVLAAANSGVDVRIMAGSSNTTDPWFMWYTSQYVRHKLLAAGVKVYEFDGGKIMHAKTVVVDRRWACVGSYNWDILSNKLLEASVAAYDRDFARTLEEHFLQDMAMSRRITEDDYLARPWYTRLACCFFYHGVWLTEQATFRGYRDRDLHSPMGAKVDP